MKQAKFIAEAANMTVAGWEKPVYLSKPTESVFEDVEVAPLLRSLLTEYLEERGIPYAIASRHCCRLNYGVRGNGILPLAFRTWQVAMKSEADISRVAYLRSLYHW